MKNIAVDVLLRCGLKVKSNTFHSTEKGNDFGMSFSITVGLLIMPIIQRYKLFYILNLSHLLLHVSADNGGHLHRALIGLYKREEMR